jgi:ribonuclease P protein component
VQRGGRKVHRRLLVVVYRRNELATVRFGLSVSRKVGTAVVRNRVKRWLREAARRQRQELAAANVDGVDIVLIARPEAATAGYETLYTELAAALAIIRQDLTKELA